MMGDNFMANERADKSICIVSDDTYPVHEVLAISLLERGMIYEVIQKPFKKCYSTTFTELTTLKVPQPVSFLSHGTGENGASAPRARR